MWTVFGPTFKALSSAIAEGVIGEVRSVRASFGVPFPRGVGSRWSAALGGSALLDQGIYPVTLANAFLGVPEETAARAVFEDEVDVTTWITLRYAGGRFAQLSASCVEFTDLSASINGTSGWITLDAPFWAGSGFTVHSVGGAPSGERHSFEQRVGGGFVPMIEAVSAAIRDGSPAVAEHTSADCLAVFAQLDEIRRRW
jgi:predicted dehydrogenase